MLHKFYTTTNELNSKKAINSKHTIVKISNDSNLEVAYNFFNEHEKKFHGIQINNSQIDNLNLVKYKFNYVSIIVKNIDNLNNEILKIKKNKPFIELIINYNDLDFFLKSNLKIDRLIVDFHNCTKQINYRLHF